MRGISPIRRQVYGLTELDCGQGIAQATLVAFEEGLGTCMVGCPSDRKLRRALRRI